MNDNEPHAIRYVKPGRNGSQITSRMPSGMHTYGMHRYVIAYVSTKLKSLRDSILCNYATKLVIGCNPRCHAEQCEASI
jgi:hypothetical protein